MAGNQYQADPRQEIVSMCLSGDVDYSVRKINSINKNKYKINPPKFVGNNPGYVYCIYKAGYIKIGRTTSLQKRLDSYGDQPPFEYEVLLTAYVADSKMMEKLFQSMFLPYQVKGEWFDVSDVERYHEYVVDSYNFLLEQLKEGYTL